MNDAFHFVRRDIERLFLRSAGGIIGHELGQSPDFGHRCAHAITKPFAHLRNRLFSAGGAVDLNDQFASSQLDIGKNGCAVLHGCHKSLPAFGRSWCRSEERRVGTACVSTCRSRWMPYNSNKTNRYTMDSTKKFKNI